MFKKENTAIMNKEGGISAEKSKLKKEPNENSRTEETSY